MGWPAVERQRAPPGIPLRRRRGSLTLNHHPAALRIGHQSSPKIRILRRRDKMSRDGAHYPSVDFRV